MYLLRLVSFPLATSYAYVNPLVAVGLGLGGEHHNQLMRMGHGESASVGGFAAMDSIPWFICSRAY